MTTYPTPLHIGEPPAAWDQYAAICAPASPWIDASQQLPDDSICVLIALADGEVWTGYRHEDEWIALDFTTASEITHWQDLPRHPTDTAP